MALSTGTLFSALKRLLDQEWIQRAGVPDQIAAIGGRKRKVCILTDLGRKILHAEGDRLQSLISTARGETWKKHLELAIVHRSRDDGDAYLELFELINALFPADARYFVSSIQRVLYHILTELPGCPNDTDLPDIPHFIRWIRQLVVRIHPF